MRTSSMLGAFALFLAACTKPPAEAKPPPKPPALRDFDDSAYGPLVCPPGSHTDLEALRIELHADAIAYVDVYAKEPPKLEIHGTPCASCKAEWDAALQTENLEAFYVPQEPLSPRRTHYVFAFGNRVVRAGTPEELRKVLAPIDSLWKAQLVVAANGTGGRCGPHAIRAVRDGYELIDDRTVSTCNPIARERWIVRVDPTGELHHERMIQRAEAAGCM